VLLSQQHWLQFQGPVTCKGKKRIICALWSRQGQGRFPREGGRESQHICLQPVPHLSSQPCSLCLTWCCSYRSSAKPSALKAALDARGFFFRMARKKVLGGTRLSSGTCSGMAVTGRLMLVCFVLFVSFLGLCSLAEHCVPDGRLLLRY